MKKIVLTSLTVALGLSAFAQTDWSTTGNAGLSTSNFVGTTDATDLRFRTDNTVRMTLDGSNGYLGLGTNAPNRHLHLREVGTGAVQMRMQNANSVSGGFLFGLNSNNHGLIRLRENKSLRFYTNNTEHLRITEAGNVGIGITVPLARLHVTGDGIFDGDYKISGLLNVSGSANLLSGATLGAPGLTFADGTVQTTAYAPGTALGLVSNPYSGLYVDDYIKLGTNSMVMTSPSGAPTFGVSPPYHLYVSDDDLRIMSTPASNSHNTLINAVGSNGNVGIGTDNPEGKTDINLGNVYHTKPRGLRVLAPTPFLTDGPNDFSIKSLFEVSQLMPSPVGGAGIYTTHLIVKDRGNVGINTPEPETKLHVHNGKIKITGANNFGGPMILFGGSPTSSPNGEWGIEYLLPQNGLTGLNFWKPAGSPNSGNYKMFLHDNGKVSIGLDPLLVNGSGQGTYEGDYLLYVGRGIMTEKVRVALRSSADWADYVFADDYELMPIEEVATYVEEHNHLPGVPSAEEVAEKGIDMAEMDAKLLEKIEELTLYMIQLKEENDQIKAELKALKGE